MIIKVMRNTGMRINTDFKPQFANPKKIDDNKVRIQPMNLNNVTITINGILPTLINSRILDPKDTSPSVSAEASTSVTSPIWISASVSIPSPEKNIKTQYSKDIPVKTVMIPLDSG